MNKNNWHSDFEMLYEDWMVTSSEKINSIIFAEELVTYIEQKYPQNNCKNTESYNHFYDKALAMQQKLAMMQYAIHNYYLAKADFESTQNMTIPSLYGMGKTKILFYVESAIIFARITLDVSANIYSDILFNCREDSFNKLCKKIDIQDNSIFNDFKKKKQLGRKMPLMHLIFYVEQLKAELYEMLSFIKQTLLLNTMNIKKIANGKNFLLF